MKYMIFVLLCLGCPERSKGWAHMQSVHAGAAQTHFYVFTVFLKSASGRYHFGPVLEATFHTKLQLWVETSSFGNVSKKVPHLIANKELWTCPEAPREAASRAHFSNKKQQFELKFQKLLLDLMSCARKCCLYLFPLQFVQIKWLKNEESMSRAHSWWSDTPWAEARRIINYY